MLGFLLGELGGGLLDGHTLVTNDYSRGGSTARKVTVSRDFEPQRAPAAAVRSSGQDAASCTKFPLTEMA
jgi:hypothetical protein